MKRVARQETFSLDINADRCVHSHVEIASCQACVDACPTNAWSLKDHALGIDESACDGCGLCHAACPEEAIRFDIGPKLEMWNGCLNAFIGCDSALPEGSGVFPCIHALNARDLLLLYRNGVRELFVCIADCDHCPRGGGQRLHQLLVEVNAMIKSRKLQPICFSEIDSDTWARTEPATQVTNPKINRRGFFRKIVGLTNIEFANRREAKDDDVVNKQTPLSLMLPGHSQSDIAARIPVIDSHLCTGCDACVRLCPHNAITFEEAGDGPEYRIHALNCSGCGICVDVCHRHAVSVHQWSRQNQENIPLTASRCRACGSPFHEPSVYRNHRFVDICPTCRQSNHTKSLFQVLN